MRAACAALAATVLASCGEQGAPSNQPLAAEPAPAPAAQPQVDASVNTAAGAPPGAPPASANPCLVQHGTAVPANSLRAVGTEPFWGARIEGRCVTYSHPDDQQGTRIWTTFSGRAESGTWSGAVGGKPFVLRTRPEPGCSDGMSDRRYPLAVALTVRGEQRSGCAEPL